MKPDEHYSALENMYLAAPVNRLLSPRIAVSEGHAEIEIDVTHDLFNAAKEVNASSYFKMLDDAAFFAANSMEYKFVVVTGSFTTYFTRAVTEGVLRSVGNVMNRGKSQFIAESIIYNSSGLEVGRGNGFFTIGQTPLGDALGYT